MRYLRARLLQRAQDEAAAKEAATRRSQLGSGDRAEKIRTYNFPDGRVTDHRIKHTSHQLADVLEGGEELDSFIDRLNAAERAHQLTDDLGRRRDEAGAGRSSGRRLPRAARGRCPRPHRRAPARARARHRPHRACTRASRPSIRSRREAFGRALCRRCAGVPTQHLLGRAEFRRLIADRAARACSCPGPRPRCVVEAALDAVRDRRDPVVVDVGHRHRRDRTLDEAGAPGLDGRRRRPLGRGRGSGARERAVGADSTSTCGSATCSPTSIPRPRVLSISS